MARNKRKRGPFKINAQLDGQLVMTANQQRTFLRRSQHWMILGAAYHAKRILGAGGYGLCALFERGRGFLRQNAPAAANLPRHIVVKQSAEDALVEESNLLHLITERGMTAAGGSEHIIKLYRQAVQQPGTGTNNFFDPHPWDAAGAYRPALHLHRIYLEYCQGGDLADAVDKPNVPSPLPEEYIWRVLDCLARAMMLLENGQEIPLAAGQAAWATPIAHFDIKFGNLLFGDHVGTHTRLPILKLADFGLALRVPPDTNTVLWRANSQWRSTHAYISPEQVYNIHANRDIGTKTNIWGVGMVVHVLMAERMAQIVHNRTYPNIDEVAHRLFNTTTIGHATWPPFAFPSFQAIGYRLFGTPYSRHLINLVHRCLAIDPADRPTAQELWNIVNPIVGGFDGQNTTAGIANVNVTLDSPGAVHVLPAGQPPLPAGFAIPPVHANGVASTAVQSDIPLDPRFSAGLHSVPHNLLLTPMRHLPDPAPDNWPYRPRSVL